MELSAKAALQQEECKRDWDLLIGTIYFSRHCRSVQGVLKDGTQTNATTSTKQQSSFLQDCIVRLNMNYHVHGRLHKENGFRMSLGQEDLWDCCSWWPSPRPPIVEREWMWVEWLDLSCCCDTWPSPRAPMDDTEPMSRCGRIRASVTMMEFLLLMEWCNAKIMHFQFIFLNH